MNRDQIIGLDKPTAAPLRLATDRRAEIERQAKGHEINRLNSVAEELALVAVMRKQQIFTGSEKINVFRAERQFGSGVRKDETHAAHCLPGQLYLNSLPIYELHGEQERALKERGIKPLPLYSKLSNLHGRTDVVHIDLNRVDSLLESMHGGRGLKILLGQSIYRLFERYRIEKPGGWEADFERARGTLNGYRNAAGYICEERLDYLTIKQGRVVSAEKAQSVSDQMIAASQYLNVIQDSSFIPENTELTSFLWTVKDVVEDKSHLYFG
jgi:hypothetical protein